MTVWFEARRKNSTCADSGPTVAFASFEDVVDAVRALGTQPWGGGEVWQVEVKPFKAFGDFREEWDSDSHPMRLGHLNRREFLVWGKRKALNGVTWEDGFIDCRDRMSNPDYVQYLALKKKLGVQ